MVFDFYFDGVTVKTGNSIHGRSLNTQDFNCKNHKKSSRTNQQLFSFSRIGANIWNGIPLKVRELEKASFKRKLKHMLLQILQTGETNVDMRYLNLSKYAVS